MRQNFQVGTILISRFGVDAYMSASHERERERERDIMIKTGLSIREISPLMSNPADTMYSLNSLTVSHTHIHTHCADKHVATMI